MIQIRIHPDPDPTIGLTDPDPTIGLYRYREDKDVIFIERFYGKALKFVFEANNKWRKKLVSGWIRIPSNQIDTSGSELIFYLLWNQKMLQSVIYCQIYFVTLSEEVSNIVTLFL